ncbi:MAG: hypothetical protein RLZ10_2832 [Bacteroidota bacterium]|jgi:tight adherence protein C
MLNFYLLITLIFIGVTLLIVGMAKIFDEHLVGLRLKNLSGNNSSKFKSRLKSNQTAATNLKKLLGKLYSLSLPSNSWQDSTSKMKFLRAGFRNSSAQTIYFSTKTVLFITLPLVFSIPVLLFFRDASLLKAALFLLIIATLGYYIPDIYLSKRIKSRLNEMQDNLADFIDLLVMCTASGLGLDGALNRVSIEMVKSSPILSEEFYLACLEIRAGTGRIVALKNLALRVNLDDLQNLVSTLVQADKFGTSLSGAMKVQSEFMRVKRFQRAEEIAAKIPVKMLLPLILFIFPILLFVLIGPAMIQISDSFSK